MRAASQSSDHGLTVLKMRAFQDLGDLFIVKSGKTVGGNFVRAVDHDVAGDGFVDRREGDVYKRQGLSSAGHDLSPRVLT